MTLATVIKGLAALLMLVAAQAGATTWYVAPATVGNGTCLGSAANACQFSVVKTKTITGPDDIEAADGSYTGDKNMLQCLSGDCANWTGTARNPIWIHAKNAGQAKINGQGTRFPMYFRDRSYIKVTGFDVWGPEVRQGISSVTIYNSHHITIEGNIIHDAGIDNDGMGVRTTGATATNNLVQFNFIYGTYRKCWENLSVPLKNTFQGNICIAAGSIATGPKPGIHADYHSYFGEALDNIIIITGSAMPASYTTKWHGCEWLGGSTQALCSPNPCSTPPGCLGTRFTNFDWQQNWGALMAEGASTESPLYSTAHRGNIGIVLSSSQYRVTNGGGSGNSNSLVYFADVGGFKVTDNIMSVPGSSFPTMKPWCLLSCPDCPNPAAPNDTFAGNTGYGPVASIVDATWTKSNFHEASARTTEDHFHGSAASVGALVCYLHDTNGVTTTTRWDKITAINALGMASMTANGYTAVDGLAVTYRVIGTPPSNCGGPGVALTNTPASAATATPTWTPGGVIPTATPTLSSTPTTTPTPTRTLEAPGLRIAERCDTIDSGVFRDLRRERAPLAANVGLAGDSSVPKKQPEKNSGTP